MNYQFDFKDKVVIVTGASSGIGRSIALAFATFGANVVLMSRNESKLNETATLVRAAGGEATVVPVDLSIFENIEKAVARVKEHYSRIDILINNSGVTRRKPSLR